MATEGDIDITVDMPPPNPQVSNKWPFSVTSRSAVSVEPRVAGNAVFVGDRVRLSAVARDQSGEIIEGKRIISTSSDPSTAVVEGDHVRGLRAGSVELVASASPTSASMWLAVVESPVAELIFEAETLGQPELYRPSLDPAVAPRRLLPPMTWARQAAVTTAGQRVAFVGRDGSGNEDIYVVDHDGSGLPRLTTEPGIDDQPVWSPDGTVIAFRSFRQGKSDSGPRHRIRGRRSFCRTAGSWSTRR